MPIIPPGNTICRISITTGSIQTLLAERVGGWWQSVLSKLCNLKDLNDPLLLDLSKLWSQRELADCWLGLILSCYANVTKIPEPGCGLLTYVFG
ncbi:hypothetical protein TorRG33x02_072740 [Trema orientale]|uniref:Uncharacterized protein n=1 Tax=Trema orientale TaxID=63057 RepID=A0A2P5FGH2_TREOI|nr:hypothetical protein TorRG33x02_072740 [Trema orientale]